VSEAGAPDPPDDTNVSNDAAGEHRAPVLVTVFVALALPLLMPGEFSLGPRWLLSGLGGVLLVAMAVADPGRLDQRSRHARRFAVALIVVLVAGAAYAAARLLNDLLTGGGVTNSAGLLLRASALVWLDLVIVFALLYWEVDSGGPGRRANESTRYPDFAFPQILNPGIAPPSWRPVFYDYLYLGVTNGTAFSPTDVMPLAHWAKFAMALQSITSLVIIGLVVARAVNILN
jgi:uncharacterized membrane protein